MFFIFIILKFFFFFLYIIIRLYKFFKSCNRFKLINDNYGHMAGDYVLIEFSKFILDKMRPNDLLGRLGGEEFILIFKKESKVKAEKRIKNIMRKLKEKIFIYEKNNINVTFSCGISEKFDCKKSSVNNLVHLADKRMYLFKHNGRNRITIKDE